MRRGDAMKQTRDIYDLGCAHLHGCYKIYVVYTYHYIIKPISKIMSQQD